MSTKDQRDQQTVTAAGTSDAEKDRSADDDALDAVIDEIVEHDAELLERLSR